MNISDGSKNEKQFYYKTILNLVITHNLNFIMSRHQISLALSHHPSLLSIASGRSSRLHSVSAQSCCMSVVDGCPAFAHPCEGAHRSMSLMNSSLLFQQCPACLVRLTWIVFVMGGKWPYRCCLQDLFNIARRILV